MNRKIDKKTTKQIRIDIGLHELLKSKAKKRSMTIKTLLEGYLAELLAVENDWNMTPEELKKATEEFKKIYKEEFGVELSDSDAYLKSEAILKLFVCLTEGENVKWK